MKINLFHRPSALLPGIASTLLLGALAGPAGDVTWTGDPGSDSTPNWSYPANWSPAAAPVNGDNLIFTGYDKPVSTNDLTGRSLGWLRFANGDFTLGGNALILAGGLTNVSGNNTVELPLTLGAAQAWDIAGGTALVISTNLALGSSALSLVGDGNSTLGSPASTVFSAVVSGSGLVTKDGPGILLWNAANNTLTGGLVVNAGTLQAYSGWWERSFFGNVTPRSITINAAGTLETKTHSLGGLGAAFYAPTIYLNGGVWQLLNEQYLPLNNLIFLTKSSLTGAGELRSQGGTLTVSNSASGTTMDCGLNMVSAGTIEVADGAAGDDFTLNGYLNNSPTLTKTGNGRLVLNGTTTGYSGNMPINAGTLALSGSALLERAPTITVATNAVFDISGVVFSLSTNQTLAGVGTVIGTLYDNDPGATGSALSPGGNSAIGTLTLDGLNLSSGSLALNFNLGTVTTAGGGVNDLITVTNLTLASDGVATNTVNFTFSGTPAAGAYTLIRYINGPALGPVTTLAAAASRSIYTFTSDGSSIKVTVVPNPALLVWRGDGTTNNWDLVTTPNWMKGAIKDLFYTGDNATFNDTGSNTPAINLVGALSAGSVTVAGAKDYTLAGSGRISGSAKLNKTSSGTLTILTANDNTGGGSLSSGVVNVGNGVVTGNLGSGNLTNNTKVNFNQSASSTYAGNMSGSGSVNAFIPGATLSLTGTNTFTGGLTIQNGTVQIGNSPTTLGSSVAGPITNYGALYYSRTDAFTNQNNVTSAGNDFQFSNGEIYVRGNGGMTVDGTASLSTLGNFYVGQNMYGKAIVNPGGLINVGAVLLLGNAPATTSAGDVIQNGGTVNVTGHVRIAHYGNNASTFSTYNMFGGTLNVPNAQVAVGWDGIGFMNLTNGTVNCLRLTIDDNTGTAPAGGTNSTFTMTGGQLNIGAAGITSVTTSNQFVPTVQLSGGTIAATAPAGFSSSMFMRLTNGSPTFDSSNSAITLSGILSGNGGLTKTGTGVLNLNSNNTYTGTTTVAAGTLQGIGVVSGPVSIQSNAGISAGGYLARGTLTVSNNVTVSPGASVVIDQASTAASTDLIRVYGNLTLDTATPLYVNFTGGLPYTGGANVILTNSGTRTGLLTYVNPTRYSVVLDQSNPNYITTTFTGTNANLVWKGTVNNLWNLNTTANWLNGAASSTYYQSDAVIFDNTGIAAPNITLATPMTPVSVTVNSTGNYKFSGSPITGLATLTKSGSGKLTLENDFTSTGLITVGAGTLQIGNGGTTGSITGPANLAGASIADFGSVVFNRSDTLTYNGIISGPGTLTQAGSGKLLLTAANTFFGGATINPGSTVQLGNGPGADAGVLGNGIVTNNGAVIFYRNANVGVATPYTGSGSFTFLSTGLAGTGGYALNATNTFTGPVTLSMARIQSGAGALSFGSPSSIIVNPMSQVYAVAQPYSSTYNIPLTLAGTGWQDGLGALRIEGGGTWVGPLTLANNARIGVNNATTNTITGTISGSSYELDSYNANSGLLVLAPSVPNSFASLRVSGSTAGATIAGNANAIPNSIPLFMNGGVLRLNGFDKSFSNFQSPNGGSIQNGSASSPVTVTLAPPLNANLNYSGSFADGSTQPLNVTFNQSGPLATVALPTLSPNWTGNLTNNGGTISSGSSPTPFGSQSVLGRNIVGNNGATFLTTINSPFNGYSGNLVLDDSTWISTRFCSFAGNAGGIFLANSTLTGTNSSDGTGYAQLTLPSTVTVRGTAPSYIVGGGTSMGYGLQGAGTTFDVADVTGNANSDLIIGGGTSTAWVKNAVNTGNCSLIKTGAGTLELGGANNYTGATIISNGTVKLGAAATFATSSGFTVASGATLDASALGTLTLGAQTLSGNGTVLGTVSEGTGIIAPGSSVGTLTVGGLTLSGTGGTLAIELNSTSTTVGGTVNDLIQVNGDLSLNDAAPTTVNFTFLNGPNAAGTYTIMKYTGALTGTAAGLTNTQGFAVTFTVGGGFVRATFMAAPAQSLVWQGGDPAGNIWDLTTTSLNWSNTTAHVMTNFYQLDTVRFDDSTLNTTVDIAAPVTPAGITLDSTNDYTFAGAGKITGKTSLTKNNTNTLTLSTANDFTGAVDVNAGVLAQGAAAAMPRGAVINAAPGAQFNFAGMGSDNTRGYSFTIAGSGPDGSGALFNSGGAIYSYANVSNLTLVADSVIGGNNGRWDIGPLANSKLDGQGRNLTKVGTFQLDMRPQIITNVASITVSNGNMYYEGYSQVNPWTATTTNIVAPAASLGCYGGLTNNMPLLLNSATIQNQNSSGTAYWLGSVIVSNSSLFNNSGAQSFYGVISGPGAMWVDGGRSALLITNANTYAGGTIISNAPSTTTSGASGTAALIAANASALGTGPLTIDGSSFSSLLTNTAFFGTNVLRPVEFNVTGGGIVPNAINLPDSGPITNVALQGRDSSSVFTLAGKISGGFAGMTNWVDFGNASSLGVMRLSNPANDFVAKTIYVNRGVLAITAGGALGNSANVLRLDQANGNAGLRFDAAGINVANNIILQSATAFNTFGDNNGDGVLDTVNNVTISGVISGGGNPNIRGTNGVLTLTGLNTCSGSLELVEPVVLQVAASTNLGTAAVALKAGTLRYTGTGSETMTRTLWNDNAALVGATIDVTSPTASLTWNPSGGTCNQILTKTGPGALSLSNIVVSSPVLTMNGGTFTVNSVISGAASQVKVNTGTLTLTAANTYGGPTLVNGGTLFVNGSLPAGNVVTVASGATLAGNGTINGPVTVSGALQPGNNSIGKLTINSVVTLMGTTTMEINKATGTNDAVVGATTLAYGGVLNVSNLGGTLVAGDTFKLFGAWAYMGSFVATNLPSLTSGLAWDTGGLLVDGSIKVVSASAAPALSGAVLLPNGNFQVTLTGTVGQGYKILASTNAALPLASWTVLQSGTLPTATYNWEDTSTKGNPTRFYIISKP
jgi:autotransporter-associated beta strand protein